jgi:hypothetical protein
MQEHLKVLASVYACQPRCRCTAVSFSNHIQETRLYLHLHIQRTKGDARLVLTMTEAKYANIDLARSPYSWRFEEQFRVS